MINLSSYIAGKAVHSDDKLEVFYPYDNSLTGTVSKINNAQFNECIEAAIEGGKNPLTRYQRYAILRRAADLLAE